jgi:hypothetical protein
MPAPLEDVRGELGLVPVCEPCDHRDVAHGSSLPSRYILNPPVPLFTTRRASRLP